MLHLRLAAASFSALTFALLLACAAPREPLAYPQAPRGDQIDQYHGTAVADPYRWLEELDSEATRAWVEAQNNLSRPRLEGIASREEIRARLTDLWNHPRYTTPVKRGRRYFFRRNDGLQNQDVLYVTESLDAEPSLLLDPNRFSDDGTVSLSAFFPSPDGSRIVYGKSDGGSDWRTWRILDVENGGELDETLTLTKFTTISWSADGGAFYYSRYPQLEGAEPGQGDGTKAVSLFLHRLGDPQSDDELVYALGDERRNPYGTVTEDGRFLVVNIQEGYLENAIHVRRLDAGDDRWIPLLDRWDAFYTFLGNDGPTFFFTTNHSAPRNRVIAVDLEHPEPDRWRQVVPESERTLVGASYVGGTIIARYLEDAKSHVEVFSTDGEILHQVKLPGIGTASGFDGRADDAETFFSFTGFTTPSTIYRYDTGSGTSEQIWKPEIAAALDAYETEQVFVASSDGTQVPMFVVHRRGIGLEGENPTLLYGYGGFNVSQTPSFRVERLVWLEMGGVFALANLRGGGEYGKAWHLAGATLNKQNVFDDFIAAAEWLIGEGYTSPDKLAVQGGSNGGLLVGAVLTQRPELFAATLPAVGVLDMLRYHLPSANARNWKTDYGLSENEEEFQAQLAYSPLHNVKPGVCYPPTLITTADHDDRVVPWHSYKFGATLQHAQGCENPILVRIETRAGHGAGTPTWMRIEGIADQWAFLARHLTMEVESLEAEIGS